jgi:hypothetical protein
MNCTERLQPLNDAKTPRMSQWVLPKMPAMMTPGIVLLVNMTTAAT